MEVLGGNMPDHDDGEGVTRDVTKHDLGRLLEILDERSRALLWHVWWHRHASISELRGLVDARGDFEVLHRLQMVINRKAQYLWGKPVVGFEQSRIDPASGARVLFNWWFLDRENLLVSACEKPLVDVFSEKDSVTFIAQVPTSVDPVPTDIQCRNGILRIKLKREGRA